MYFRFSVSCVCGGTPPPRNDQKFDIWIRCSVRKTKINLVSPEWKMSRSMDVNVIKKMCYFKILQNRTFLLFNSIFNWSLNSQRVLKKQLTPEFAFWLIFMGLLRLVGWYLSGFFFHLILVYMSCTCYNCEQVKKVFVKDKYDFQLFYKIKDEIGKTLSLPRSIFY